MRRAQQLVAATAAALAALVATPAALAFHAAATFDVEPGGGGAGRVYYTGSPRHHGWQCTLCHTDPPGKISLRITQPDLFAHLDDGISYEPGKLYEFTVDLVGEHAGLSATRSNYNSLVVEILDERDAAVGTFFYAETEFSQLGDAAIAAANNNNEAVGTTRWKFKWKAPGEAEGPDGGAPGKVTFYFSAVDGDGAGSDGTQTLTDAFHDDFFSVKLEAEQGAAATGRRPEPPATTRVALASPPLSPAPSPPTGPAAPVLASVVGLALAGGMARRLRRRS